MTQSPELIDLFTTYTAGPDSIGAHLAAAVARGTGHDPLLVITGTDVALYPGGGQAPVIQPYRLGNRGFKELAGISHLGPALATLARLREIGGDEIGGAAGEWRADASRLLAATRKARTASNTSLWRDTLAVRAFAGREERIAAMVNYSCLLTERFLRRALDDPGYLTMAAVRNDFLAGPTTDLPVPFNKVMIATFYLTGMDIAHRLITWFDAAGIDWARAMVIFAGQPGRPTSGVTEESHSVAGIVRAVSRGQLAPERLFIAPHAPVFPPFDPTTGDTGAAAALEDGYRRLWAGLRATGDLGGQMFDGYPRFAATAGERPVIVPGTASAPGTASVAAKPAIGGPDDWFALVTRLRVVMEDPRQLLSGAVTDYASSELVKHDNNPAAVTVPGLDGEPYPQHGGGRVNAFTERLRKGEPTLMLAIRSSRTADVVRIAKATGHHAVMIDLEHSTMSLDVAASLAATATDLGLFAFVRIPEREYGAIGSLLDTGVQGIIAPRVETAAEADTIARACRFAPRGQRSQLATVPQFGLRPTPAAELNQALDEATVVQMLIETPAGVAIAAVDGVDMLAFGANDFTAEIGAPGKYGDPRVTSAIKTLANAAHQHGKLLMVGGISDPARLRELDALGVCPLRLTGTDTDMLYAGAAARAERFAKNG